MTLQPPAGAPVVTVMDGPFAGFEGVVSGIDQAKGTLQLLLSTRSRPLNGLGVTDHPA